MQQGGTPQGPPPPESAPLPGAGLGPAETASPISARHPPAVTGTNSALVPAHQNFPEDEFGERGSTSGNRWPRQETLALINIRSAMDAVFREATPKGPLWEDISRKLSQLGYRRSPKKCREKFENVHKYYKRTKEGRAGRQDGKSYRFFDQLEALHVSTATISPAMPTMEISNPNANPTPTPSGNANPTVAMPTAPPPAAGFSSDTFTSSDSDWGGDEEYGEGRKRKRGGQKMMDFFDGMMKMVMERQEAMQRMFLEAVERREHDRTVREEAWRRQEIARLAREHDLLCQERATAASRDAAIISFLQKLTGQSVTIPATTPPAPPPPPTTTTMTMTMPNLPQIQQHQEQESSTMTKLLQTHQHQQQESSQPETSIPDAGVIVVHDQRPYSSEVIVVPDPQEAMGGSSSEPASSRWPKAEVHALINLRSGLDAKYQEVGPKGPLWEEISSEMARIGYSRSSKRCKEKWENINKYFKKVKESSKKRPEDAKTCPYFHQLDALYRQKLTLVTPRQPNPVPLIANPPEIAIKAAPLVERPAGSDDNGSCEGASTAKPEGIVNDQMKQQVQQSEDSNGVYDDEDDDEGDDEDDDDRYRVQIKRPDANNGSSYFENLINRSNSTPIDAMADCYATSDQKTNFEPVDANERSDDIFLE